MAVSKVAYDGHTLIDLTQDTAVESDVADGKWFHKSNGERVQGTSGKVIVQGSDSSAFLIRPTAGETLAPLDCDRKSVLKKLGNTVGVNQLVDKSGFPASKTESGITFTNNGDGSVTANGTATATVVFEFHNYQPTELISGHKYYIQSGFTATGSASTFELMLTQVISPSFNVNLYGFSQIFECGNNVRVHTLQFVVRNGATVNNLKCTPILSDAAVWFGSNDNIPSDLLSHPENWGRYYAGSLAYNAGTLESADGTVMRSIGRNCWDEEWEQGGIDSSSGLPETDSSRIRSKNLIPSIPGATYYIHGARISWIEYDSNGIYLRAGFAGSFVGADADFTISADAHFIKFFTTATYGGTYKSDITISLYYSGESGYDQYYPYSVLAEVDTGSEVLRSAGSVADEKIPDGTITRRVGFIDVGTLTPTMYSSANGIFRVDVSGRKPGKYNLRCATYVTSTENAKDNMLDKEVIGWEQDGTYVYFRNMAFSGHTIAQIQTAMSGVILYYELATPTSEQGTAFTGLQKVDGHGTEMVTGGTTGIPVPFTAQYLKTINAAPTDTIVITENGSHDVAMYAGAIVNVSGGGTPSLQSKTVNLDSNAPSTVYPGTGYNGLSSVSFNTAGINAANIKAGTSVCGVAGTYAALTYDRRVVTPPVGTVTPIAYTVGWQPDVIVFEWTEDGEDESESDTSSFRRALARSDDAITSSDNEIMPGHDTVTFTSTGYTLLMNGTYWNDYPERFGDMTITAIKLS